MHAIRLHGPWECEPLSSAAGALNNAAPELGNATIPFDWAATLGDDYFGRARLTRRFHRPTGLEGGEQVYLVIEGASVSGAVSLNGEPLGELTTGRDARFLVTQRLAFSNVLTLEIEVWPNKAGAPAGMVIRSVRLEIE